MSENGDNFRLSTPGIRLALVYTGVFVFLFAIYLLISLHHLSALPELDSDALEYDAIAFNITHHRGFGYDWNDPDWRHPYLQDPQYQNLLSRLPRYPGYYPSYYPSVYRPPAMPYLLALVYVVSGRNFAAWRIVSCALMAGAATLAAAISAEFAGLLAAIITALLILLCPMLTRLSHLFFTESLATFLMTFLVWMWLRNAKNGWSAARISGLGVVCAALVATRYIFLLWIPVVALSVPAIPTASGLKSIWRGKAICLCTTLLIIGPWCIRNILVTKEFMPFGSQAQFELINGFGPMAVQSRGVWAGDKENESGVFAGEEHLLKLNLDPLDFEVRLAKIRSSSAVHWMLQRPLEVIQLMFLHVYKEVKPAAPANGNVASEWLLFLGALAAFVFRKSQGVGIIVLFVALNIIGIALTWSAGGRFMAPAHPLIVALVAAMVSRQLTASMQQNYGSKPKAYCRND
jgi:4-amino-4-deoxy-L-arabinose transferase-like glycosyltransferase